MSLRVVLAIVLFLPVAAEARMRAHYINVGQADATLLEFERGAILIDAGGEFTGDSLHLDHLVGYLSDVFANRPELERTLDAIIITHPHIDHTRNLMGVLQRFRVKALIDGGDVRGSGIYPLFLARRLAGDRDIDHLEIKDGDIPDGGLTNDVIDPYPGDPEIRILAGDRDCRNQNNDSLVVRVAHAGKSFLFTGDAEFTDGGGCDGPEIDLLLARYDGPDSPLDVDVYQVGHHGSHNGTNVELMKAMSPQISVISAGYRFRSEPEPFHAVQFGHPRTDVVELLVANTSGAREVRFLESNSNGPYSLPKANKPKLVEELDMIKQVYCTCWDGDVIVEVTDAGELRVTPSGI